jgi:hypothetical protein
VKSGARFSLNALTPSCRSGFGTCTPSPQRRGVGRRGGYRAAKAARGWPRHEDASIGARRAIQGAERGVIRGAVRGGVRGYLEAVALQGETPAGVDIGLQPELDRLLRLSDGVRTSGVGDLLRVGQRRVHHCPRRGALDHVQVRWGTQQPTAGVENMLTAGVDVC